MSKNAELILKKPSLGGQPRGIKASDFQILILGIFYLSFLRYVVQELGDSK